MSHKELLEQLMQGVGVSDASSVASSIIERFGSLPLALSASALRLSEVNGVTGDLASLLKTVKKVAAGMARNRIELNSPRLSSISELLDYLQRTMTVGDTRGTRVLFSDRRQRLIADEILHAEVATRSSFSPVQLIRRALELSASSMILIQKTSSEVDYPSEAEIRLTKKLVAIAGLLNIFVVERMIIGSSEHLSFRKMGILSSEPSSFSPISF
jgi:DNA repair protein RadC